MERTQARKLLKNREVVEEINRHLWIESEKAGYNIGFEAAAEDWLKRFSAAWVKHHLAKTRVAASKRKARKPKRSRQKAVR